MNKKIKIITEHSEKTFEYSVNNFLSTHKADDIQYQFAVMPNGILRYSVMITYQEW